MWNILAVGMGGALGSVARYSLAQAMQLAQINSVSSILCANVLGCFFIGLFIPLVQDLADHHKLFLVIGFLGGFTTFSSFALEAKDLLQHAGTFKALGYVFLTNTLCLLACGLGAIIAYKAS